jgi:hypothetical protein
MTNYRVPEVLRQDSDGDEIVMPTALAEYHVRRTVGAD